MSLALLVLWALWLLWVLWVLSGVQILFLIINKYFKISTYRVMCYVNVMRIWNIIEQLRGNDSTTGDVSVKSIMSVLSVVMGLFSLQIDTEKLAWHC